MPVPRLHGLQYLKANPDVSINVRFHEEEGCVVALLHDQRDRHGDGDVEATAADILTAIMIVIDKKQGWPE